MDVRKEVSIKKQNRKISRYLSSIAINAQQNIRAAFDGCQNLGFSNQLKNKINKNNVQEYFCDFQANLSDAMIINEKKYTELQRGLYLLLKGKVCYTWTLRRHDVQKKQNLFNLAKTGVFLFYSDPCLKDQQIVNYQSFPIEQPLSIFECESQNCFALEDCILIKVQNRLRANTKFDQLYLQRLNLIQKCHLSGQANLKNSLFSVNLKLHSTFKTYQYKFHHRIQFQTIAIIQSGVVKPVKDDIMKMKKLYTQLQKFAVLLPGIAYEVYSTTAKILVIQNNPTLNYIHKDLITAHKLLKMKFQTNFKTLNMVRESKTACNSVHLNKTPQQITSSMKKWEASNRRKKLTNISKEYQNQLIITMQTCKQSLSFSQQQTEQLKKSTDKYRKPKILFDYSKYCTNKSLQNFHKAFLENKGCETPKAQAQIQVRKQRKTFNDSLMRRYKYFSKQMYRKFNQKKLQVQSSLKKPFHCHFDSFA